MGDTLLLLETAEFFNNIETIKIQPEWRLSRWTSVTPDNRTSYRSNEWKWPKQILVASNQALGYAQKMYGH